MELNTKLPFFLFHRHAYHSVSTPPVYPPKNDLKLHVATSSLHSSDAVIIHPGAMLAMLDLLASVGSVAQPEVSLVLLAPFVFNEFSKGCGFACMSKGVGSERKEGM